MSALASPATWRSHPHTTVGYLFVLNPTVVFACSVNQADFPNIVAQLTYDNVTTGAFGDVEVGMLVKVMDSSSNFKAWGRVRLAATSAILYVGHVSAGEIDFADDDLIQVLADWRLQARIPRITKSGTLFKDYNLAYSDQGSQPPPVCNAGGWYAGFVDSVTSVITVAFTLTSSFAVANGATISSYSGDIEDGTVTVGSIASGSFTATFPAGKRWIRLRATDSNGKTHDKRVLIVAAERTGANAPLNARIMRQRYHVDQGAEMGFLLLANDVGTDVVPEGTAVIYFEEEVYNGVAGSLNGLAGREHIKFVGWIAEDGVRVHPDTSDVTIRCISPTLRLNELPAFPQTTQNAASPDAWNELTAHSLFRHLWYLLYWHSTALDVCDFEKPGWDSIYSAGPYRLDSDGGSLFEQVNRIAGGGKEALNARFTADRNGKFYVRRNPQLMTDAERTALTTIVTLAATDWAEEIGADTRHQDQIHWIRGSGILASNSAQTPYLSIAPGKTPSQGAREENFDRQLVTGQSDLNTRVGHFYAWRNAQRPRLPITILNAGLIADPAWQEWMKLTLASTSNRRELAFTNTRFVPIEVNVEHDPERGAPLEHWILEEETSGVPGKTVRVPEDDLEDPGITPLPPPHDDGDDEYDPGIPPDGGPLANSPALYIATPDVVGRTYTPTAASPAYIKLFDNTTELQGDIRRMILDPWAPKYRMYIATIENTGAINGDAWVRIYEATDIYTSNNPTVTLLHTYTNLDTQGVTDVDLTGSINVEGYLGILICVRNGTNATVGDVVYVRRTTYTGSFSQATVRTGQDIRDASGNNMPAAVAPEHYATGANTMQIVAISEVGEVSGQDRMYIRKSTDGGQTWAAHIQVNVPIQAMAAGLIAAYENSDSGNKFFALMRDADNGGRLIADVEALVRSDTGGVVGIAALQSGSDYYAGADAALWQSRMSLHIYTQDSDVVSYSSGTSLHYSADGGASYQTSAMPVTELWALGGWPYDPATLLAWGMEVTTGVYWTVNGAAVSPTWNNAIGTWATDIGAFPGAVQVVPIWIP